MIARPTDAPNWLPGVPQGAVCDQPAEAPLLNRDRQRPSRLAGKPRRRFGKPSPTGGRGFPRRPAKGSPARGLANAGSCQSRSNGGFPKTMSMSICLEEMPSFR